MELIREKKVKTRKPHRCFGCARLFDKGSIMEKQEWADGGTIDSSYLCNTCYEITHEMKWYEEYGYSELRDEAFKREGIKNENY